MQVVNSATTQPYTTAQHRSLQFTTNTSPAFWLHLIRPRVRLYSRAIDFGALITYVSIVAAVHFSAAL